MRKEFYDGDTRVYDNFEDYMNSEEFENERWNK